MKPVKVAKGSAGSSHPAGKLRPASNLLPTVESTDRPLSAALLRLAAVPTPAAHMAVGDRYRALGILDMAYEHYRARVAARSHGRGRLRGPRAHLARLGISGAGHGRRVTRGLSTRPASASAHNTWGTVLAATGHRDDARRQYERAVELDAGAAYAWNNLCYLSFLDGDDDRAAAECRTALSVDPGLTAAAIRWRSVERRQAREFVP